MNNYDELRQLINNSHPRGSCDGCRFCWVELKLPAVLDENAALREALEDAADYVIAATGPGRYALLERIDKVLGDAS